MGPPAAAMSGRVEEGAPVAPCLSDQSPQVQEYDPQPDEPAQLPFEFPRGEQPARRGRRPLRRTAADRAAPVGIARVERPVVELAVIADGSPRSRRAIGSRRDLAQGASTSSALSSTGELRAHT